MTDDLTPPLIRRSKRQLERKLQEVTSSRFWWRLSFFMMVAATGAHYLRHWMGSFE